ncbi:type VI secretion system baseplate subunit TssK [Pseudomonas plecoglossicida]|uniref:Type VI secretion system baseplate subunit TssK n=1 Tax=Pseudomonas plecoglossicida TaxID=70775 RepID=A0AAD0VV87_PSEDL|nr:type VI secretion system baseplate subunit TssK [Pseudomonas plecoglossicida]AXM98849.1 type VI secretion system baseplate subunit TssK [Pseudomonas plecoglossicida]EPB95214.1 type VI secretion protein [Pseudomonas plecoglossicida NB2011]QLB54996.1 type VI secretion system baseplate subunit TssK [Pseudomonas plecoglossicida]
MTTRNPVAWSEGLFVKPQHFQQTTRYLEHYINARHASRYGYGFSELELNQEFLAFGKIAIVRARGIMPDGSLFNIPNDQPPPQPLTLSDAGLANQTVYLTLPLQSDGIAQVRWPDTHGNTRYVLHTEELLDTHSHQGSHAPVALAVPSLQLALQRDDRSAFTSLALGRILERRPDGHLLLDTAFYITGLYLSAIRPLAQFIEEVFSLMQARAKNIAQRIGSPSQSGVADFSDFNLLQALNRWQHQFRHMAQDPDVSPLDAYLACGQACGELATCIDHSRLAPEFPAYQHDNLKSTFQMLEDTLRRLLGTVLQPRAVSVPLVKQGHGILTAQVTDSSLMDSADFILAVRARMPLDQMRQLFLQQTKVASQQSLLELIRLQLPGIPLSPLPVAPRHLPFHAGFTYYQLDRTSTAWQKLIPRGTNSFGLHISGEFPELQLQFWAIRSQ